ncbi:unconventional myosin-Va-like isoform X1 [Centruroides sculpturatus]|uniref:unconventional myosin-Va-like isoform X1 n=2 Tax=Centruroides sculpturatus TaxID=218467 RepID=UPI000C6C8EBE|nr:unconventional myosin-Va-like isoform X1 [Centruroides sculpturatus]
MPEMSRCVLLPDQLYEDSQTDMTSEDTDEEEEDELALLNVYQRELRKIRDNLRAIHSMRQGDGRSGCAYWNHAPSRSGMTWRWKSDEELCPQVPREIMPQESLPYATLPRRGRARQNKEGLIDVASSNEAVHLQQRLRSLSSELVTLRNRLHMTGGATVASLNDQTLPSFQHKGELCTSSADKLPQNDACAQVHDLVHLSGPLTEDAVLRTLTARFYNGEYFTNVGPILLAINPYKDVGNPLTLNSATSCCPQLLRVVHEAVRQHGETGYPQSIILSGDCGSGKTYSSMLMLRQLFDVAGGGPETDAFKHLAAAFTVLRSLGTAKTSSNSESSRIGHFIELQMTDGALYRTKIHCYFLDQTRVVRPHPKEKNYHIFYQMLAGLTSEERSKLYLDGYSIQNLHYLNRGDTSQNESEDAARFLAWKTCLSILGIPFMDVVRVLAAVLLLGNIQFVDGAGLEVEVKGSNEIKPVAALLGISSIALFKGLTTRTRNIRGQLVKSASDALMSNMTRDALAKALYCRTVATIVRRANSLKRLGSTSGTLSSDSNDSVHNQTETGSQHASTVGSGGGKVSKSLTVLNSAVRHATDGFIGILDMFGFEDSKPSHLEHLCINLCAETLQHFYNTHVFKSSIESCREEGVLTEVQVDYVDNVPCIDLISSLRTGLLSMLDTECSVRGTPESYIGKVKAQHKSNNRIFEIKPTDVRAFGIRHFAGNVVYDASNFLDTNRDVVPDDIISVFHTSTCTCGFATYLFGSELKALYSQEPVPRGVYFRISPTAPSDLINGDEPVSTLTQDFHSRLDNLLKTLVHAKPHFIRCIKANNKEQPGHLDRAVVMQQIRSLQVLETLNLMATGHPHRMRFKAFNYRYHLLAPSKKLKRTEESSIEDCKVILDYFVRSSSSWPASPASTDWALGKRHIFLSEGARQQLELLRMERRQKAAILVQSTWRGWNFRQRWPNLKRNLQLQMKSRGMRNQSVPAVLPNSVLISRPRPQPIAGTPPPDLERCNHKTIQQTCTLFGLDLERPPPVPPSRPYTVAGNTKLGYPQTRVMKMNYTEDGNTEVTLHKGESVLVMGASQRRGHLVVEYKNRTFHVPYQHLELKPGTEEDI